MGPIENSYNKHKPNQVATVTLKLSNIFFTGLLYLHTGFVQSIRLLLGGKKSWNELWSSWTVRLPLCQSRRMLWSKLWKRRTCRQMWTWRTWWLVKVGATLTSSRMRWRINCRRFACHVIHLLVFTCSIVHCRSTISIVTHAEVGILFVFVCLFVCFSTLCFKANAARITKLTHKCSTISPGNPFILGQKSRSRVTKNIAGVGLCTLVSAGFI